MKKSKKPKIVRPVGRPRVCYSYEEAQKIISSEGLTSRREYFLWWKYNLPARMPKRPDCAYKNYNFSWKTFLGYKKDQPFPQRRIHYQTLDDAKLFAQPLGLRTRIDWLTYIRNNGKPKNIPTCPDIVYKKKGTWISWKDFLGYGNLSTKHELLIAAARPIFFVVRLPNRPANIFKFGFTLNNIDSLKAMHNKTIQIVRCYYMDDINDDWQSFIEEYGSEYMYGQEDEYAIQNIAILLNDLNRRYMLINL